MKQLHKEENGSSSISEHVDTADVKQVEQKPEASVVVAKAVVPIKVSEEPYVNKVNPRFNKQYMLDLKIPMSCR